MSARILLTMGIAILLTEACRTTGGSLSAQKSAALVTGQSQLLENLSRRSKAIYLEIGRVAPDSYRVSSQAQPMCSGRDPGSLSPDGDGNVTCAVLNEVKIDWEIEHPGAEGQSGWFVALENLKIGQPAVLSPQEIDDLMQRTTQSERDLLASVRQKSKEVYTVLSRLLSEGGRIPSRTTGNCSPELPDFSRIRCQYTDDDPDFGWTEGFEIRWLAQREDNSSSYEFLVARIDRIEH